MSTPFIQKCLESVGSAHHSMPCEKLYVFIKLGGEESDDYDPICMTWFDYVKALEAGHITGQCKVSLKACNTIHEGKYAVCNIHAAQGGQGHGNGNNGIGNVVGNGKGDSISNGKGISIGIGKGESESKQQHVHQVGSHATSASNTPDYIHKLPTEILQKIFGHLLDAVVDSKMSVRRATAITRVCSTLRRDAHAAFSRSLEFHIQLTERVLRTCASARTEIVALRRKRGNDSSIYRPATVIVINASVEAERHAAYLRAIDRHLKSMYRKSMYRGDAFDIFEEKR